MEILRELKENKNITIALGYFDGVHLGHKKIIETLIEAAKVNGTKSAVLTFKQNPSNFFREEKTLDIQTFKDKEMLIEDMGVDYLYEIDFEQYKDLTAQEYLENVLVKYFKPKAIIVGYNHTFGKNKGGNALYLQKNAEKYGFEAIIVPQQRYTNSEEISSSIIRKKIANGELAKVKSLLGRNFSVRNSVVKGDRIARTLGFPTANLIWPQSLVKLPYGVYLGFTQVNSKIIPSMISWGCKPTLSDGKIEVLETHILNLNEDLYGKLIKVIFV
ncbi:riboflavin biosynthesis protein RibF, partial [bacterium]|nr:riboflavin biosynthesis protein RibF [bacterium]